MRKDFSAVTKESIDGAQEGTKSLNQTNLVHYSFHSLQLQCIWDVRFPGFGPRNDMGTGSGIKGYFGDFEAFRVSGAAFFIPAAICVRD